MISVIISKTYADNQALNLSIITNKSTYLVGDDVEVKIKLNEKVMTASYYFNYDSSILTYKETKTTGLAVRDYPNENLIRAVYVDMSGIGTNEIILVFTLKEGSNKKISLGLTNTTMTTSKDGKPYSNDQINGINNNIQIEVKEPEDENNNTIFNNIVENIIENEIIGDKENEIQKPNDNIENKLEEKENQLTDNKKQENNSSDISTKKGQKLSDNTISNRKLPNTGNRSVYKYLIIIFIIISAYLGYNVIKLRTYFKF